MQVGLKTIGGMNVVSIRPFEERDNAALLAIEKQCTQGDDKLAMGVDKSPAIIARYKMYDNWIVITALCALRIILRLYGIKIKIFGQDVSMMIS